MKKTIALFLIILLPALIAAQTDQNRSIVFDRVTIIDVKTAALRSGMTVLVTGDRIAAIGKTGTIKIPKNAEIIEARGKFLIPGLWDMHAHLGSDDFDKNAHLRLFIAGGVTGIRLMDGDAEYYRWRRESESGNLPAPRMSIASRQIGFGDLANVPEARARAEVRRAKRDGADFIKVHDYLSRESYFAVIDEATRSNLPVAGHVPVSITAAEAARAGQKSIEHFTGLDEAKADVLIAFLKKYDTWLCPTIIMRSNYASLDNTVFADDPRLKYIKPSWKKRWLNMTNDSAKTPVEEWKKRRETIQKEKALAGKMRRAGVGILAGTDTSNPYVFPGFSLHDELALLVEAGLTPLQALQAATINPAKFFGRSDSPGTIEKGKPADLVLLDANPLENIGNTKKINAVVLDGRLFDRNALDKMLAEIESAAKSK